MSKPRIGIMGGTFDPIHYGHLAAAEGARHLARLDQVLLVPAVDPPHKQGAVATPAAHRLAMVELAIAGHPALAISQVEFERPGPHYTVDTLAALEQRHPGAELHFIMGLDSLLQIETWHDYPELLRRWPVLAVTRPGSGLEEWERLRARLGLALTERVAVLDIPGIHLSSSDLRRRAAAGYPLRYLVPDDVAAYAVQHRLYAADGP